MRRSVMAGVVLLLLALFGLTVTLRGTVTTARAMSLRNWHDDAVTLLTSQAEDLAARGQSDAAAQLLDEARQRRESAARFDSDVREGTIATTVIALVTALLAVLGARPVLRHRRDSLYRDVVTGPPPVTTAAAAGPSTVFLSYSRKDAATVRPLHDALVARGREMWVDWTGIAPTADWMQEIVRAIERADAVLFVVSPDSLDSRTCREELAHAVAAGKRIIPVLVRDVDGTGVPEHLGRLHWVTCRTGEPLDTAVDDIVEAIDLDFSWVQLHTWLYVRAREWDANGRDPGSLLGGADLNRARSAVLVANGRHPALTELHQEYVAAAEQNAVARTRKERGGAYLASLAFGVLFPAIIYSVAFDEISESGLVMLTPVWVMALVFGITGLTARRATWRRPVLAVVAGLGALAVFFEAVFPVL
ncbi:toll/interleukin-1 receptor domain-containing protein [Actinoplanes sp. NBRC 101535]|uniref:toll/interleukin-1 receptor domain-containing protein n=1 Tax=Actinoplanes sp. NBRC 101535 TaxID=3032196 RepID=UPI0025567640|nr:toll/interleukin-1 receptor domain-containing protein [Actinoplanes sp. NBRC 101535]